MNTDFGTYIKELVKKFRENGISAEEKSLQYGCQLVLAKGTDKAVLSVYNGKNGIKFVWNGKNAAFTQACKDILADGRSTGTNYSLLKNLPQYNRLWAGRDDSGTSGKGDFFGPLVVAAVACDEKSASRLFSLGVKDCKIVSDKDVLKMKDEICSTALAVSVLALTPKMYNYRYNQLKAAGQNLNHLLSSGHAAALTGVIGKCPGCGYALVDRFAVHNDITQRIHEKYPAVKVVQMPKAEADIAVAAASVLARAEFLRIMAELEAQAGIQLPKGGSDAATSCARIIAEKFGKESLANFVKLHFANYKRI